MFIHTFIDKSKKIHQIKELDTNMYLSDDCSQWKFVSETSWGNVMKQAQRLNFTHITDCGTCCNCKRNDCTVLIDKIPNNCFAWVNKELKIKQLNDILTYVSHTGSLYTTSKVKKEMDRLNEAS